MGPSTPKNLLNGETFPPFFKPFLPFGNGRVPEPPFLTLKRDPPGKGFKPLPKPL